MTRAEAPEALWQWILEAWHDTDWGLDIDGPDLHEKAFQLGLLRRETYDPAIHGERDMETGDDIYFPVEPGGAAMTRPDVEGIGIRTVRDRVLPRWHVKEVQDLVAYALALEGARDAVLCHDGIQGHTATACTTKCLRHAFDAEAERRMGTR